MSHWHGMKGMWVERMLDPRCDFELWPHPWPWPLIFKVIHLWAISHRVSRLLFCVMSLIIYTFDIITTSPWDQWVTSSPLSAAYMHQWTESALVQIMACRLNGAKPLSEPVLTYCQIDTKEHASMKFYLKFKYSHSQKYIWTCRLWIGGNFFSASMCQMKTCSISHPN